MTRGYRRVYPGGVDGVRIDKWLWAARFFKTRGLATEAVVGGHVHVNDARVKPARAVAVGDRVEIRRGTQRFVVVVQRLSERRGPAPEAQQLYEETPESIAERERQRDQRKLARPIGADLTARPTKRDRRRLDALRRARRRR
jgi:ribosome-associated heat shock protein Hsp15